MAEWLSVNSISSSY